MYHNDILAQLRESHGIVLPPGMGLDAQPTTITVSNAGIPAFLTAYMDPKVIEVLVTPNTGAKILGESKKGDWTTRTAVFAMVESVGEVSSYGDWNNNGTTNANVAFPERQSYHYQTITQWGEKQLAEAGAARLDWAGRLNIASAIVLDKFQNNTYFYGVGGLKNYGLLNDPSLPAPVQPATKQAGGRTWAVGTPNEIYADIQALYGQLVAQTGGIIQGGLIDQRQKMVLATSPAVAVYLSSKNSFGLSVYDMLKDTFPNIRFETAVQYSTPAGNVVQLIAEEVDGQEAGYCAFTEKMRAHPVIADISSFKQKKSQGTWGTIIFLPMAFAQMIGV